MSNEIKRYNVYLQNGYDSRVLITNEHKGEWVRYEDHIKALAEEKERYEKVLNNLLEKTNELIEHCADRGFIDFEDDTIEGVNDIKNAIKQAQELLTEYRNQKQ